MLRSKIKLITDYDIMLCSIAIKKELPHKPRHAKITIINDEFENRVRQHLEILIYQKVTYIPSTQTAIT